MIKIKDADAPNYLFSPVVEASKIDIREQVENGVQHLAIHSHWGDVCADNTIKDVLFETHDGKCCYCERKRTRKREIDVEHYRPKAGVKDAPAHKGYWWLAYDWNNYLWSCKSCNQGYKKNQFPLLSTGVRAETEGDSLPLENPCLINPRFEEPSEYLAYHKRKLGGRWLVKVIPLPDIEGDEKQRADKTIRILGLNRTEIGDDLVSERGESLTPEFEQIACGLRASEIAIAITAEPKAIKTYERIISGYKKRLKDYIHPGKEFAGFFRYYLTDIGIDYSDLI